MHGHVNISLQWMYPVQFSMTFKAYQFPRGSSIKKRLQKGVDSDRTWGIRNPSRMYTSKNAPCLWHAESQLRIQVYIVVPGQPVRGIELTIRQRHHLGEAGVDAIHFVNHALRYNDRHITYDLHRSIVDGRKALACALVGLQGEPAALLHPADEDVHRSHLIRGVCKAQLGVQVHVVVPG